MTALPQLATLLEKVKKVKKNNMGKSPIDAGLSLQARVLDHLVRKGNN